eukprot:1191657-Prorocentrum_minimum.AAC.1
MQRQLANWGSRVVYDSESAGARVCSCWSKYYVNVGPPRIISHKCKNFQTPMLHTHTPKPLDVYLPSALGLGYV